MIKIKKHIKNNIPLFYIYIILKTLKNNYLFRKCEDKKSILFNYKNATGNILNLENPKRFTEKLQWLKLYYRNQQMRVCADKYAVRKYVKEK